MSILAGALPTAALLSHGRPHTVARTASRAAVSAQLQFGPPPAGFEWGYCTLDSLWEDGINTAPAVAAPASPAPESVEHDVFDPRSTTQTYEQKVAAVPAAALSDELSDMSVPNACKFMADPTLDGMSVEQKAAYLASKGVDAFVIAQATCVAPEDNVQGHPELPVATFVEGQMGVPAACKFMADPTLDGMSVDVKSAFLASKGVDAFIIAQATCVAPEDNVQGHPELPVADGQMSVPQACKFMADATLEGMPLEEKSAFLASKGVDAFVIAQSTCVTNEDNVQGHPELPVADGQMSVPQACKFMADATLEGMPLEEKSAFLASKGVDEFVIAQATCVTNEDNVQGHPELPVADGQMSVPQACKFMADATLEGMPLEEKSAFLASKGVDEFVIAQATCVTNEDNVQGHPELPVREPELAGVA